MYIEDGRKVKNRLITECEIINRGKQRNRCMDSPHCFSDSLLDSWSGVAWNGALYSANEIRKQIKSALRRKEFPLDLFFNIHLFFFLTSCCAVITIGCYFSFDVLLYLRRNIVFLFSSHKHLDVSINCLKVEENQSVTS